jgi:hypothetical protein
MSTIMICIIYQKNVLQRYAICNKLSTLASRVGVWIGWNIIHTLSLATEMIWKYITKYIFYTFHVAHVKKDIYQYVTAINWDYFLWVLGQEMKLIWHICSHRNRIAHAMTRDTYQHVLPIFSVCAYRVSHRMHVCYN